MTDLEGGILDVYMSGEIPVSVAEIGESLVKQGFAVTDLSEAMVESAVMAEKEAKNIKTVGRNGKWAYH